MPEGKSVRNKRSSTEQSPQCAYKAVGDNVEASLEAHTIQFFREPVSNHFLQLTMDEIKISGPVCGEYSQNRNFLFNSILVSAYRVLLY